MIFEFLSLIKYKKGCLFEKCFYLFCDHDGTEFESLNGIFENHK